MNFDSLLDMIDGGGAGMAGDTFVGGPFSELLNAMGVRPRGYADRQQAAPPMQPTPAMATSAPAPAPAPEVMRGQTPATGYVGSTPYSPPPVGNLTPGSMTLPNLMDMAEMGRAERAGMGYEQYSGNPMLTAPEPDYSTVQAILNSPAMMGNPEAERVRVYLASVGLIPGMAGGGR